MTKNKLFALLAILALPIPAALADISVSGDLNFGNVPLGSTAARLMTIGNTGEEPITVSGISFPAGFNGNWSGGAIAGGDSKEVRVVFAPTSVMAYGGDVTVNSDAPAGGNTLAASGTGVASATSNDMFANRFTLAGTGFTVLGSNAGMTKEGGEPDHAGNAGGASVWWTWTAPESGEVIITTAGSTFDTLLAVYVGGSVGELAPIAVNDDEDAVLRTSRVVFNATGGTTYQIAVDGYDGETGNIQLTLTTEDDGGPGPGPGGFTPIKAKYTGLFFPTADLSPQNAGLFTATTTARGRYSAKLTVDGKRYSASGPFDGNGAATHTINRRGMSPLELNLQVDDDGDVLVGTISDGEWVSNLVADRATFNARQNPAPQAGKYTLIFPGAVDASVAPGGDSFGAVTVRPNGALRFKGSLADGTKVSQSVSLSKNGQWPLYVPLYSRKGSIIGWLNVSNEGEGDISGLVDWFKPELPRARHYRDGFVLQTEAVGSPFNFTRGMSVIDLDNPLLVLEDGNLSEPLVLPVVMDARNNVNDPTDRKTRVRFTTSSGLFKGNVTNPEGRKALRVNGVALQNRGFASGYFLGTDQSGRVLLTDGPEVDEFEE